MPIGQENVATKPEELIEHLSEDVLAALAALEGATPDFVSLALAGLPRGTRMWAQTYGLVTTVGTELALTDHGRAVVAAASVRVPEPYADVTLSDLLDETREAVERLAAASDLRVETPARQYVGAATPVAARVRGFGRRVGQRVAVTLGRRAAVTPAGTAADTKSATSAAPHIQH